MVIWLLGISGSGKTTIAKELKKHFDKNDVKSFIIDGDIVRDFYDNDLGYSKEDRVANIKRIMLSAYLLEQNGVVPIVANISPFEFLREFAREKFENYFEVYLKREIQTIKNKDFVYKDSTDVVGVDMLFDEPTQPSLTLDTAELSVDECVDEIVNNVLIQKDVFDVWNAKKKLIDKKEVNRSFEERDIIYLKMGKNIGFEQDGKGDELLRPVLVYKKFNNHQFIGFAMTSKKPNNKNKHFYYKLKEDSYMILTQVRTYSAKRISHTIGRVSQNKLKEIDEKFSRLVTP